MLAYNSYKFCKIFFAVSPEAFSLGAVIGLAMAFNLLITGVFAFAGFVFPTHKLLPGSYYQIKNVEALNTVYKWLGVVYFKYFLLMTFYRKADNKKYFSGTKAGIIHFDYNTKQSEFGHLMAFIIIVVLSVIPLYTGHQQVFIWIHAINIVFNFYPIILQRKHRMAIQRLVGKI